MSIKEKETLTLHLCFTEKIKHHVITSCSLLINKSNNKATKV